MYNIYTKAISKRGWFTLLALIATICVSAQNVKGVVVDETDMPMIGATVMVKGSQTGTTTDFDGNFTIQAQKGSTLVFSYIGYKNQEVKIAQTDKKLNIKMEPDNAVLDEVIVVGYGSMKKSDLTGSVASVAAKDIEEFKSSSVMAALGGQVAGVQITQTDGTPGAGFDIKIRGVGTLNGDATPLYIVDGFQVDNIDYLANSDIESIQILKDASSSAIYGARAANGVVMVTTKSGKVGRPVVSYNGSATYRKITKQLDLLNAYEFVKLQGELDTKFIPGYYRNEINPETGEYYKYRTLDDYIGVESVDWQGETFSPTWSQDHNISVTGGNDGTKYSASFSHYKENGIFRNSGFTKTTGKVRINQKINKYITADATINYSNTLKEGAGTSGDGGRFNMLGQILRSRPTGGLAKTNEELLASAIDPAMLETGESLAQVNPILQAENTTDNKRSEMWSANLSLTAKITKKLTFKTAGTYNTTNTRRDVFYKTQTRQAYTNGQMPYGETQMGREKRWTNYNQLTWVEKIKQHRYEIMLGEELAYRSSEFLLGQAKNFPSDNIGNDNLGLGAVPSKVNTSFGDKTMLSFFARGNYSFNDKYMLTATVRADGSTVFSYKNKWGFFPAFSAAWRISEEKFMKQNLPFVSNMKLRLGWGIVGNDRIANFLSLDLYTQSKYGIGNTTSTVLTQSHLKNKNLKWEGSSTTNLGVDLGFFDNRLNVTADFFIKNTKDLLLAQNLAYVTGFSSQMQNIGKIQNRGIELAINSTNIQNRNFTWSTDFNISFIRNELKALSSGANYAEAYSNFDRTNYTQSDYRAIVGESLGLIYGYEFDGIYQVDDFYTSAATGKLILKPGITNNTRYDGGAAPGVVKYKDQNGDGKITTADRTVIGNAMPKWFGGITNSFSFKGIDFSFMLQYSYGNDVFNATRQFATGSQDQRYNMLAEVADRWSPTNASNKVPSTKGYVKGDVYSRFVEDGSFLRLKNMTLGHSLPKRWINKIHISKLRIYGTAQNLFCISGYSGYDPEVSTAASNPMTPGLDWGAYPKSRVFTFGLDVQF